ncbi:DUF4870 domain-containing protein [Sinomicrobium weinanense]|uniref:DUF4870 domain-containing protein n=1 Tax=Sinomicrobium weinanense TaxID=2842200 RepID=A0A926JVR7_9FLAO|nr:DUF4870 domain-containing protein [Sinomicrobium weinanense]MBC9798271.1 DUF4870 domain-containing protein [Sinomicrobium weinanense]MBU3125337.1 DUF4870 domain-containing protein [Sinomicrobium weinanense]
MNAKTISIVSYITIIGWIIAYLQHKGSEQKSALASYHLGQGLGVFIFAVILSIVINILARVVPALGSILSLVGLLPLVLLIFGIIAANNEAMKPVPLIGKFFEGKFNF